jgi:hypothetical protein
VIATDACPISSDTTFTDQPARSTCSPLNVALRAGRSGRTWAGFQPVSSLTPRWVIRR